MSIMDRILDKTTPALERALDMAWQRGQAIASNVANAETPKYRAVELDFKGELERAFNAKSKELKITDPKHMDLTANSGARLVADLSGPTKADGNNVDIDTQMIRLQRNQGDFTEAATILRKQLRIISQAIRNAN